MRDRSRQLADCRVAVEVCELRQALTRFDFGEATATPFTQQSADQHSLDQHYDRNQRQLPRIFFPDAGLTKQDFPSWGQLPLPDAPPPLPSPLVLRSRKADSLPR